MQKVVTKAEPAKTREVMANYMASVSHTGEPLSLVQAGEIALRHFAIDGCCGYLSGEHDQNFRLTAGDGRNYVLKISHPLEDPRTIELACAALLHLERSAPELPCPRLCRDREGRIMAPLGHGAERGMMARLFTWVPGRPLRQSVRSRRQRAAVGRIAASLAKALRNFHHPAVGRAHIWDLAHFSQIRAMLPSISHFPYPNEVHDFFSGYSAAVELAFASLRRQVVHNDLNGRNVIVDAADEDTIAGIIDFGDVVETALIADVAIAASAQLTSLNSLEADLRDFLFAYHALNPLTDEEYSHLNWLGSKLINYLC